MISQILMIVSAGFIMLLGGLHLIYTFMGPKLLPRDPTLRFRMEEDSPVISSETTMWRAWIGFNASHSMGAMLFGLLYGFLAVVHPDLLFNSPYLLVVGTAALVGYVFLARLYWFSIPFAVITVALLCFAASIVFRLA